MSKVLMVWNGNPFRYQTHRILSLFAAGLQDGGQEIVVGCYSCYCENEGECLACWLS